MCGVAVKGELAPLSAQPAVIAATMAMGVTPRLAASGMSGARSVTARIGFMPICPAAGMIQTKETRISQGGMPPKSSPACTISGPSSRDPMVPM